jgi:PIN domain nuclease of toxin-antitoxin system
VFLEQQLADNSVQVLPVDLRHALQVAGLPPHHKDPFDRMLVAQAMIEGLAIVTSDEAIAQYTPEVIW